MSRLEILDVSNFIYAGSYHGDFIQRGVKETNGQYVANEAPIGGVRFLLKKINNLIMPDVTIIPVFDRLPTVKREAYNRLFGATDGYKGNRKSNKTEGINEQRDYAEVVLRDLGFPVQAVDGYEADDIIYTLVQYYYDDYDEIRIHTIDSDLFFLVDNKVSIHNVTEKGKVVTKYNFEGVVKAHELIKYNTLHLRKLYEGDKSDNIPGVGIPFVTALDMYIHDTYGMSEYAKLGDLDLCRKYISEVARKNPDIEGAYMALSIFNLLVPYKLNYDLLDQNDMDVDQGRMQYYLYGWDKNYDDWHLEDLLAEYIDTYQAGR